MVVGAFQESKKKQAKPRGLGRYLASCSFQHILCPGRVKSLPSLTGVTLQRVRIGEKLEEEWFIWEQSTVVPRAKPNTGRKETKRSQVAGRQMAGGTRQAPLWSRNELPRQPGGGCRLRENRAPYPPTHTWGWFTDAKPVAC